MTDDASTLGIDPCVDNDPMVVAHAQALLADGSRVAAIRGDVRHPEDVICHDEVQRLIDFSRPVAVLLAAVLHQVADVDGPVGVVAQFMDTVAPGSHLVLSHPTHDRLPADAGVTRKLYERAGMSLVTRSKDEIGALFAGLELVAPGLVFTVEWRPHQQIEDPGLAGIYAGVARKPHAG